MGAAALTTFVLLDWFIERGAFLAHFGQAWTSHFGGAKSFEYGSADEHPFDWSLLLKNWDITVPAMLGVIVLVRKARSRSILLLPLGWLVLAFGVFATHKPWWAYYYLHTAIPLCWCAAVGVVWAWKGAWRTESPVRQQSATHNATRRSKAQNSRPKLAMLSCRAALLIFLIFASGWLGARVYLQVSGIRSSPQVYTELVLNEIKRLNPEQMYADQQIYSFHSGVPFPADLAVLPLKRFWAGEMTNERIAKELVAYRPGVILLANDGREVPFQRLLEREYYLAYFDREHRLYAIRGGHDKTKYLR